MKVFKLGDDDDKIDTSQYITKSQADKRYVNEIMDKDINMNQHKITNTKEGEDDNDVCTIKNLSVYYRKGSVLDMGGQQIKNAAYATDENDVCTLKQVRELLASIPTIQRVTVKIVASNLYKYYILKSFDKNVYAEIHGWEVMNPNDHKFRRLKPSTTGDIINVYYLEELNTLNPQVSMEAEKSYQDPSRGLDLAKYGNKNGIVLYCEKTPSISDLNKYFIEVESINWIYIRVTYMTSIING